MNQLFKDDYFQWSQQQATLLKNKQFDQVDAKLIADGLRAFAARHEQELKSRLAIVISDLLQWQYTPDLQYHSWRATIGSQRDSIKSFLRKYPAIQAKLPELFKQAYEEAVYIAALRTDYWFDEINAHLWPLAQILDDDFWPELWPENSLEVAP